MKVLHVIDSMDMGGAQSLIAELAPAQKEQGVEVQNKDLSGIYTISLL